MKNSLKEKIQSKEARIGVIGLGYVGLPLIIAFGNQGFKLIGFDIDPDKVSKLNKGQSYIQHIESNSIKSLVKKSSFKATTDFAHIKDVDIIIICVPTPLTIHRNPDLKYVESTCEAVYPYLQKGQLVILESTTYPGTSDEVVVPLLQKSSLTPGKDFLIAYSPEREDPGNPSFDISTTPKVVGGYNKLSNQCACALYQYVAKDVIPVSNMKIAEGCKILENIYRAVNIALVNELKILFDKMDVDIWEIIDAAKTKPFGFQAFYPGPGLGGHCIPIDPFYLTWKAKEYEMSTRFIELAGEINSTMPQYVIQKTMEGLNTISKALKGSEVVIFGMAYKKDVDDIRESPSLEIMKHLKQLGAKVSYFDPHISQIPKLRNYNFKVKGLSEKKLLAKRFDAALILTDHTDVDYKKLLSQFSLVVDTRNITGKLKIKHKNIVKA